jgi:hypothetical protein
MNFTNSLCPSAPGDLVFSVKLKVHFKMLFRFVTLTHVCCYTAAVKALHVVSDAERRQFAEPNSVPGGEPIFISHPVPHLTGFSKTAFDPW